jgi:hypothetical protein
MELFFRLAKFLLLALVLWAVWQGLAGPARRRRLREQMSVLAMALLVGAGVTTLLFIWRHARF